VVLDAEISEILMSTIVRVSELREGDESRVSRVGGDLMQEKCQGLDPLQHCIQTGIQAGYQYCTKFPSVTGI
jgi:hypothetical protein